VVSTVEPPVVSPSATPFDFAQDKLRTGPVEPTVEIATATPTADLPIAPVPGARAPDFTLTDLNGNEVSLTSLRGQAVLLNFWATW
jgi:cytochrome oxidase Cu insertion factor (SCO1/SenC/PrrC family)